MNNKQLSLVRLARLAGLMYLMIIVLGAMGQLFIRGSVINIDAATTYQNLMTSGGLWRLGIIGDILMHALDIPVMVILYQLLKRAGKSLAKLGVLFNVIQTAVLVANKMLLIIPMVLIHDLSYQQAFSTDQIQAQVQLLTNLHDFGFGLGLLFFGLACLTYGYLIYRSEYFPKLLGVLISNAGLCYFINSVVLILAQEYSGEASALLLFSLIGELSFSLWLIIKGLRAVKL